MIKTIKFLSLIVMCNTFNHAFANQTIDLRLELSLEDLLNLHVDVATKSSMPLHKSPAIARVFTQDDIQRFGFQTLADLLLTVPSFQINPFKAGNIGVFVRGVQGRNTSKILLLIDGAPMRDAFWGNFNIDEMVSMTNIKRIEILNGPGSVIHGANAFAAVISITTKSEGNLWKLATV